MDDGRNVRFQKGVKSMKKMNLKNFFMKKKIAAGCIAAAALITQYNPQKHLALLGNPISMFF